MMTNSGIVESNERGASNLRGSNEKEEEGDFCLKNRR